MKENLKYLIVIVIVVILLSIGLYLKFNESNRNLFDKELDNYDMAITRIDINCKANTIYLKKDEIYVVYFEDNKKQEIVKIKEDINIKDMVQYVKEMEDDILNGLKVTLKDGTTKIVSDESNIITNLLRDNNLFDSFCSRKISSNIKTLKCLENNLGGYIVTENDILTDIPINEITDKWEDIIYYKGVKANDNNMYVMVEGVNDIEVVRDFEMYFSKRFSNYQSFVINNINVYIHNDFNDIDFSKLQNRCQSIENTNGESLLMATIDKLNKTNKIVVKSGDNKIGTIDKQEVINKVLEVVTSIKRYGEHFLCDGNSFDLEMYNDKGELIDIIYLWRDGGRLIPKSVHNGCLYYMSTRKDIDLRKIIEQETDYIFYNIFDYSDDNCKEELELIYEDEKYNYYLACKKSDKVMIDFKVNNLTMTLKEALNKNYITPKQLEEYTDLLIKEEK